VRARCRYTPFGQILITHTKLLKLSTVYWASKFGYSRERFFQGRKNPLLPEMCSPAAVSSVAVNSLKTVQMRGKASHVKS
jgi:hypothetical protein